MKRMLITLSTTIIIIVLYSSCKKGPDDPFISLLSRKERISGYWKISTATESYGDSTITETDTYNADGTLLIALPGSSLSGTYVWTYQINKDGSYSIFRNLYIPNYSSLNYEEDGNWYFLSKNKAEGLKNKECIAFQATEIIENNITYKYEVSNPTIYIIDELKSKEVILKADRNCTETNVSTLTQNMVLEDITLIPHD